MNLLFDLSKEHISLPALEICTIFESYNINYSILHKTNDILIVRIDQPSKIIPILTTRLAFTYVISEYYFSTQPNLKEINTLSTQYSCTEPGTIAIRYRNRSQKQNSKQIIQTIAKAYTKNRTVDLQHPTIELYVIITDDRIHVGRIFQNLDRSSYEKRKVQYRPFFSPISLHPKLARGLCNLGYITKESTVLDPFCGTGGFLIEAGLIGCSLIGSDIQKDMINGTKENLSFYGITDAQLFQSDIGDILTTITKPIDAVITDAPYGKSTTTNKEKLDQLYKRTLPTLSQLLKPDGTIVIGLPKEHYKPIFTEYFQLKHIITIPVHRSLTRYFYIGKKTP